jgi:hypothetical protein
MRFRADGPSIPVELLEQRDRGNVVFFWGAGVSKPAGLPSFPELGKRVMKALGTDTRSKSRVLLEQSDSAQNLDRVFNLLHQEYRRDEVDEAVNRVLRTPLEGFESKRHQSWKLGHSLAWCWPGLFRFLGTSLSVIPLFARTAGVSPQCYCRRKTVCTKTLFDSSVSKTL